MTDDPWGELREQVAEALRPHPAPETAADAVLAVVREWDDHWRGQSIRELDRQVAALTVERDDLTLVCDAYGLPHSALALDHHLTGNAALTTETWKATAEGWKVRAEKAEAEVAALRKQVDTAKRDALRETADAALDHFGTWGGAGWADCAPRWGVTDG
jgi:hypothetical protein